MGPIHAATPMRKWSGFRSTTKPVLNSNVCSSVGLTGNSSLGADTSHNSFLFCAVIRIDPPSRTMSFQKVWDWKNPGLSVWTVDD